MIPVDSVCDGQFGFRKGRGTSLACALYNDVKAYFDYKKSPLFTCSLDAEKCFDSIWHYGLFAKLLGEISDVHWATLFHWYSRLEAMVRWNGVYSCPFAVTRGTRQGSILSPSLFNIFIDDLLVQLNNCDDKVCRGSFKINSFAYADDVTLLCTTVSGLQRLINICADYARDWKFRFGLTKSKCMISGNHCFNSSPTCS